MSARDRSAGVLVEDAQILLVHRWRGEDEYFVVPDGGVEDGETPEQACAREMLEEVNLSVEVGDLIREMPDGDRGVEEADFLQPGAAPEPSSSTPA